MGVSKLIDPKYHPYDYTIWKYVPLVQIIVIEHWIIEFGTA